MNVSIESYRNIADHVLLNSLIDDLTYNQFFKGMSKNQPLKKIEFDDIKKCIWLCSILASSIDENHKRKVQLFTALVYLQNIENTDIERACFLLLSRCGNLIGTRLFNHFNQLTSNPDTVSIYNYDALLNLELAVEWNKKLIQIEGEEFITSNFQKELWDQINEKDRISISAPTSAGKSHIIKKFIKSKLLSNNAYYVLYIVPSRALINQVSEEFRKEINLKDTEIRTAFIDEKTENKTKKIVYILTPERCLSLLQKAWKEKGEINLIFIDEIQNVENEDGRGSLFEYVFKELHSIFPKSKIVVAGPNIKNNIVLFHNIFGENSYSVETNNSPVFQIKTIIRPLKDNKVKITLKSVWGSEQSIEIKTEFDFNKKLQKSYAEGLPDIINLFTNNGQNIIFSPRTDYVEDWTLRFVENSEKLAQAEDTETKELIEFLEDEINSKYYLINCLKKKAAFHHSKLPDIVRKEIEDGFLEGRITNLFCTSTLLEGVNLPANNLFIVSAKKQSNELTPFEFGNLIGRAGRIRDSLYGTIYCIERDVEDVWAEEYYDKSYDKDVVTVAGKALSNFSKFQSELKKQISDITDPKDSNTVILLRHKYLNDRLALDSYLQNKGLTEALSVSLIKILSSTLDNLSIPKEITRINPSIDPLKQNELYLQIKKEGIRNWAITINTNFYAKIDKEKKDLYKFEELNLFWQLVSIMERLDKIFDIQKETYFKHNISISTRQICFYGTQWLNNTTYKKLIDNDIKFYSNHTNQSKRIDPNNLEDVNERINQVIKVNSTVVSYILVKYLKVLNDILAPMMDEEQQNKYKFSLALPIMLELGTSEPIVIQLISRGISRSVALKVFNEFKRINNYKNIDVFEWLKSKDRLGIKSIYNRYLRKMRLLKE